MKIKQQTVTSHPPRTEKSYIYSQTFFDRNGNMIEFRKYKGGKIEVWEKFAYDAQQKLVEKLVGQGNSFKPEDYKFRPVLLRDLNDKEIVETNSEGQKVISTFYLNGTIKTKKYFNENDICIEENEFKKETLTKKAIYNQLGQLLEVRNFRSDGTPLNYTLNTYNQKNQLCRSKSVSRTDNVTHDRILKYNDDGLLIEDIDHPVEVDNADAVDLVNGYSHKYFYNIHKLKEAHNLYLCGELVMVYKYTYEFWEG